MTAQKNLLAHTQTATTARCARIANGSVQQAAVRVGAHTVAVLEEKGGEVQELSPCAENRGSVSAAI